MRRRIAEDLRVLIDMQDGHRRPSKRVIYLVVLVMNLASSIHVVWFYLSHVPCYLDLAKYEQGLEKTPFQNRLLMMLPLRWAHQSTSLNATARWLTGMPAWFPRGVRPEGLLEAPIDLACVILTGLVARSLYAKASKTGILKPYVYPLTLLMIACTYSLYTLHRVRFVYDLPSVAFFSTGLYVVYFRRSRILFAAVFLVATVNRETSVFLLLLYVLSFPEADAKVGLRGWSRWLNCLHLPLTAPLLTCWIGWHLWVGNHFLHNASESWSRVWLNVGILLWPTAWPQLLSAFAFCWPFVFLLRREVEDRTLRAWQWVLPLWVLFMLRYGIFVEVRIFGELIPYIAAMAALIAEEHIVRSHLTYFRERSISNFAHPIVTSLQQPVDRQS